MNNLCRVTERRLAGILHNLIAPDIATTRHLVAMPLLLPLLLFGPLGFDDVNARITTPRR
jgi:hypothetical protein